MQKKDWIGWILFIIGFVFASIYGLNVPPWGDIPKGNVFYVIILAAQGLMIFGAYNLLESARKTDGEQKKKLHTAGMAKLVAGGVAALACIILIAVQVPGALWQRFFLGAAIALFGCGVLGIPEHHKHTHSQTGEGHIDPLTWINQILDEMGTINYQEQNREEIQKALEKIELERLIPFVKQRHRFAREYGATGFAEFFSTYSSGEMFMNRAWSSLVDGYPDESRDSVKNARQYFEQTLEILKGFDNDSNGGE